MLRMAWAADRQEMSARLPLDAIDLDELEIGLVDECGGAEGVAAALVAELAARDAPELVVDQGDELVQGLPVAVRAATGGAR